MKRRYVLILLFICLLAPGCVHVTEFSKKLWGSSTQALEEARKDAVQKSYPCDYNACFDAVLAMVNNGAGSGRFSLFQKDRVKRWIIIMDVPNSVDTTEVGIFFTQNEEGGTLIEMSSLSSNAKTTASEIIFNNLDQQFSHHD